MSEHFSVRDLALRGVNIEPIIGVEGFKVPGDLIVHFDRDCAGLSGARHLLELSSALCYCWRRTDNRILRDLHDSINALAYLENTASLLALSADTAASSAVRLWTLRTHVRSAVELAPGVASWADKLDAQILAGIQKLVGEQIADIRKKELKRTAAESYANSRPAVLVFDEHSSSGGLGHLPSPAALRLLAWNVPSPDPRYFLAEGPYSVLSHLQSALFIERMTASVTPLTKDDRSHLPTALALLDSQSSVMGSIEQTLAAARLL